MLYQQLHLAEVLQTLQVQLLPIYHPYRQQEHLLLFHLKIHPLPQRHRQHYHQVNFFYLWFTKWMFSENNLVCLWSPIMAFVFVWYILHFKIVNYRANKSKIFFIAAEPNLQIFLVSKISLFQNSSISFRFCNKIHINLTNFKISTVSSGFI